MATMRVAELGRQSLQLKHTQQADSHKDPKAPGVAMHVT